MPNCCPYCKRYEGKVYSISGKDTRFPALYETALQKGYNIMHPNCRHEFIPFVEEMYSKEELQTLQKESNHFPEYRRSDKIFRVYNQHQALQRQWLEESREYEKFKALLGNKMPYKTLGGFRRARRANSVEYQKLHNKHIDQKQYNDWKEVVGENIPKTLEDFQEMKYNKREKFKQILRQKETVSKIEKKEWTTQFKEKAKKTFFKFLKKNIELSDHGVARLLDKKRKIDEELFEDICNNKPFNYIQDDGKYIKQYCGMTVVYSTDKQVVVSVMQKKTKGIDWHEIKD